MQDGVFSLKWRLPQGRVPITNSILEMKDESGEWKPLDGPFKGNSFIFKGDNFCSSPNNYIILSCPVVLKSVNVP